MIDVLIIGGGPSGMSAALYALRSGKKVTLLEKIFPGGQLLNTEQIDNYPGFPIGILGKDLAKNMFDQINYFDNFSFINSEAVNISKDKNIFLIKLYSMEILKSKTIILATGGTPRLLNIPGEKKFLGKGISYCSICDGFFFKNKNVAVVGGGNTAVESCIYLSKIAFRVNLIHRRNELRATNNLIKKLNSCKNVNIHLNTVLLEICGSNSVGKILGKNIKFNKSFNIDIEAVFIAIGQEMNTDFVRKIIKLNSKNHVQVDLNMNTSVPGIFACGDIINKNLFQVSTAVGDGAIAGQQAASYTEEETICEGVKI